MNKLTKHIVSFLMVCCMMMGLALGVSATPAGSSDASLKTMAVQPGELTPAFSSGVYEYTATVENDVDKILIGAETTDSGAKMVIVGNSGLAVGENQVYVNVTAADGVTLGRYTIVVTRLGEAEAAETTAAETASDTAAETVPETVAPAPAETSAATAENGAATNASLLPGLKGNGDTAASASGPVIQTAGKTIKTGNPGENAIPEDFTATKVTIGDQEVDAWSFPVTSEIEQMVLIYGEDEAGKTGFYLYDKENNSVVSAPATLTDIFNEVAIANAKAKEQEADLMKQLQTRLYIIIGLAILAFILFIVATTALSAANRMDDEDDEDEYDEEDDEETEEPEEAEEATEETRELSAEVEEELEEILPEELAESVAQFVDTEEPAEALAEEFSEEAAPETLEETVALAPAAAEDAMEEIPAERAEDICEDIVSLDEIGEKALTPVIPEADEIIIDPDAIPEADDDVADIFASFEEMDIDAEAPAAEEVTGRRAVIYDRNAEKNVEALTVDEGNEELDADFDLLESILSEEHKAEIRQAMDAEEKKDSIEEDDDFEFFNL